MKLKIYWIPQVPMKAFEVEVKTAEAGAKLLRVLADYDEFQIKHKVKPDCSNAGGLMAFDTEDKTDSAKGSWVDWCDEETGIDDPEEWLVLKEA